MFANNPIWHSDPFGDTIWVSKATYGSTMAALRVLNSTEVGKLILKYYMTAAHDHIYIYGFDTDKSDGPNTGIAETNIAENNTLLKNGKIKLATRDSKGNEKYANSSGFKFKDGDKNNLIGRNFTNNLHAQYDEYDLAFVLYHEMKAHVKSGTGSPSDEHAKFGNYGYVKGMQLWYYDKDLGQSIMIVQPGTDAWKAFKEILAKKVADGKGTTTNVKDLKYMNDWDKPASTTNSN